MTTPTILDRRAVAIQRETNKITTDMNIAHMLARRYCQPGVYIPTRVIMAHAREVATNAYDAARERERAEHVKTRAREAAE